MPEEVNKRWDQGWTGHTRPQMEAWAWPGNSGTGVPVLNSFLTLYQSLNTVTDQFPKLQSKTDIWTSCQNFQKFSLLKVLYWYQDNRAISQPAFPHLCLNSLGYDRGQPEGPGRSNEIKKVKHTLNHKVYPEVESRKSTRGHWGAQLGLLSQLSPADFLLEKPALPFCF